MTDWWLCSRCNSINRQRDRRCYRCQAPHPAGPVQPRTPVEAAIATRTVQPYQSTRLLTVITIGLIVALAGTGIAIVVAGFGDHAWFQDQSATIARGGTVDQIELSRRTEQLGDAILIRTFIAVTALVFFAWWLGQVIANIPSLGRGTPSRSPARAFIDTLIPLWNLIKVPGMIQDALYWVEPTAGGFFMVSVAWFALAGSWLVSFVGSFALTFRLGSTLATTGPTSVRVAAFQGWYNQAVALDILTTSLVAIGGLVLVTRMFRIERRYAARDREIRAVLPGPVPEPAAIERHREPPEPRAPGATRSLAGFNVVAAYSSVIAAVEIACALGWVIPGAVVDAALVPILLGDFMRADRAPRRKLLLVLALIAMLRVLSIAAALPQLPTVTWYVTVGGALLMGEIVTIRLLEEPSEQLHLVTPRPNLDLAVAALGIPAGFIGYLLLRPPPLMPGAGPVQILPGIVVLVFMAALVEELLFRGLLQSIAIEWLGSERIGLAYAATMSAVMYLGSGSLPYTLGVGAYSLLLGTMVLRGGSLWGTTASHGVALVGMAFLWPVLLGPS